MSLCIIIYTYAENNPRGPREAQRVPAAGAVPGRGPLPFNRTPSEHSPAERSAAALRGDPGGGVQRVLSDGGAPYDCDGQGRQPDGCAAAVREVLRPQREAAHSQAGQEAGPVRAGGQAPHSAV